MTVPWQPGIQYNYGDVVLFEGYEYSIIQPHRSQSDWSPPVTPALWGRRQGGGPQGGGYQGGPPQQQWSGDQKQYPAYGQQDQQAPAGQLAPEQGEKHWYDVDDETKKKLEVGGGLLAGAAVLGAGIFAYKHHQEHKEEQQAQAWSESRWYEESVARTQQWRAGRYSEPVAWIWNEGTSIPRDAIQGGEERGERLFIARVYHEGGILVGKASTVFKKGAVIGYKKDEIHFDKYEILVGDSRAVRWVSFSGQLDLASLRGRPVEGGREPSGHPIYIAQAPYHGAVHPGKASELYGDGCFIPYDDTEKKVKEYAVLTYA